jgi:NTP pyrophosphatase (non-canonical NTP hydrolase)
MKTIFKSAKKYLKMTRKNNSEIDPQVVMELLLETSKEHTNAYVIAKTVEEVNELLTELISYTSWDGDLIKKPQMIEPIKEELADVYLMLMAFKRAIGWDPQTKFMRLDIMQNVKYILNTGDKSNGSYILDVQKMLSTFAMKSITILTKDNMSRHLKRMPDLLSDLERHLFLLELIFEIKTQDILQLQLAKIKKLEQHHINYPGFGKIQILS